MYQKKALHQKHYKPQLNHPLLPGGETIQVKMKKLIELIYIYFCRSEGLKAQRIVGVKLCIHITAKIAPMKLWGITSRD
jgi:hypothetical protein